MPDSEVQQTKKSRPPVRRATTAPRASGTAAPADQKATLEEERRQRIAAEKALAEAREQLALAEEAVDRERRRADAAQEDCL